jgi:DNA-binding response OmpR family regulator
MTFTSDKEWLDYLTRPIRFLLIEDDPYIREMFKQYAAMFNCLVDEADLGMNGLEMFKSRMGSDDPYQAVFLDMRLPDSYGVEIFRTLKSLDPVVPVVIVSGFVDDDMLAEVQSIGVAAFMRKPDSFNIQFFVQVFSMLGVKRIEQLPKRYAATLDDPSI